jgi:hypothetical protein
MEQIGDWEFGENSGQLYITGREQRHDRWYGDKVRPVLKQAWSPQR